MRSEAISLSPRGFSGLIYNVLRGTLARLLITQFTIYLGSERCPRPDKVFTHVINSHVFRRKQKEAFA